MPGGGHGAGVPAERVPLEDDDTALREEVGEAAVTPNLAPHSSIVPGAQQPPYPAFQRDAAGRLCTRGAQRRAADLGVCADQQALATRRWVVSYGIEQKPEGGRERCAAWEETGAESGCTCERNAAVKVLGNCVAECDPVHSKR